MKASSNRDRDDDDVSSIGDDDAGRPRDPPSSPVTSRPGSRPATKGSKGGGEQPFEGADPPEEGEGEDKEGDDLASFGSRKSKKSFNEEDIDDEERRRYFEEHKMVVDGMRCPDEFINDITPMEFEELVALFRKYDVNANGEIDKHEARKILESLGMETSIEEAGKLLKLIDTDGSGEISFDEYIKFIVLVKNGDLRLVQYAGILGKMQETPLGELEKQCRMRDLKMEFFTVEVREATAFSPKMIVVELRISGTWHIFEGGRTVSRTETKRFQGIANNARDAKYNSARDATKKFGSMMPGVNYAMGVVPEEWLRWVDENLARGVSSLRIVSILYTKGFHPYRNVALMQRITIWALLDQFLEKHPDFSLTGTLVISAEFQQWVRDVLVKGFDGECILRVVQDRGITLQEEHLLFAQKLRANEFGPLMDYNGKASKILDFWQACEDGGLEDVLLYLKGGQNHSEEKMGRYSGASYRPLTLAAQGGHVPVVRELLAAGADPLAIDRKGRSALHHAAANGHIEACKMLIAKGGSMFEGDFIGNTPMHLAAAGNHTAMIDFLAEKGLDLTRTVTSDKQRVLPGVIFDQLAADVFKRVQDTKLSSREYRRFNKTWCFDAAVMFRQMVAPNVRIMLAPTSPEMVADVVSRFDPRPETTVPVFNAASGKQVQVPVVPGGAELAVILKYVFRASAIDPVNSWKRTPLHVACDLNMLKSHYETVRLLIDVHGSNVLLRDIHSCKPIDLLIKDKYFQMMPSATQQKEEIINEERDLLLAEISAAFDRDEAAYAKRRRQYILDDCTSRAQKLTFLSWEASREASVKKQTYLDWEMYEDPDTLNLFYAKKPVDVLDGDKHSDHTWDLPDEIFSAKHRRTGMDYLLELRSERQRSFGDIHMYRDKTSGADFYVHGKTREIFFTAPPELQLKQLAKKAVVLEKLGFRNEWQAMRDEFGNIFYRNAASKDCFWDRPLDALRIESKDKMCSGFQFGYKAMEQNWYSCESCNRAWKNAGEAAKATLRICEPCIFRCHDGHKGVRFTMKSSVICNCVNGCRVTQTICNGCSISEKQISVTRESFDYRTEVVRKREHLALMPPCFTCLPPVDVNGKKKLQSGWMLCRRPPPQGFKDFGKLIMEDENPDDDQSDSTATSERDTTVDGDHISIAASITAADVITESSSKSGSLLLNQPLGGHVVRMLLDSGQVPYLRPAGLPEGWIEVCDVEDPNPIPAGSRILVVCFDGPPKCYASISGAAKKGFYKVRWDHKNEEEVVDRSRIHVISRPIFYSNPATGETAWSIEQAKTNPYKSCELSLPGREWLSFASRSSTRRLFETWEERRLVFQDNKAWDFIFYANMELYFRERSALRLQAWYRKRFRRAPPYDDWPLHSLTTAVPESLRQLTLELSGWGYLKRRSQNKGDFRDEDGEEWEEFVDNVSCEYFYFMPAELKFSFIKPPIPKFKLTASENEIQYYEVGDDLMYKFEGEREEEPVVVTQRRFDDETGEDMYDVVHRYMPAKKKIWVQRAFLKPKQKNIEVLELVQKANKWRALIKAQRAKEARNKKREKDARIAAEMEYLRSLAAGPVSTKAAGKGDTGTVSSATVTSAAAVVKAMQGKLKRVNQERIDYEEDVDRSTGVARREAVRVAVEKAKEESEKRFTRAEILSMTRAFDMKLRMEEKVAARDKLQKELHDRKAATLKRERDAAERLKEIESVMATPRSMDRRDVVRKVNMAMRRQLDLYMLCEWGCKEWVKIGYDQIDHQLRRCPRRILGCTLGCPLKLSEEDWLRNKSQKTQEELDEIALTQSVSDLDKPPELGVSVQQFHETEECPKRLVPCPRNCLEWVCFEELVVHMEELCTKRPAKAIFCRLNCGCSFGGLIEQLIEAEDDRLQHETEECDFRIVRCNWKYDDGRVCAAQMPAFNRDEHRDYHLLSLGQMSYRVPGTYLYTVPKKTYKIKIQAWGAGGGSGYFYDRSGGSGGGGAFVETIIAVEPYDVLEIVVGAGGGAGACGTDVELMDTDLQRKRAKERKEGLAVADEAGEVISATCGTALGGRPGGGDGYGGNKCWASGGGGGYSIVAKKTNKGNQALVVAAGGGGGGSVSGMPGVGMDGELPGTLLDPRNGCTATSTSPGQAGDSGSIFNADWTATDGQMWLAGNGCEYGAGGGGGYYGGGGGGNSPGIGGGGGGGSSYLYLPLCLDHVIIPGSGIRPGGLKHNVPDAVGVGEWDKVDGPAGQGAQGAKRLTFRGNNGAVRITLPGHY